MSKSEKSKFKKLKKVELEILDEFLRICKKNNLTYFMVGGSLLGTVRHEGFIPWDNDIDVGMPRKDYDKFCKVCKTNLKKAYFLQNYKTEPNCGLIFSKLRKNNTLAVENENIDIDIHHGINIDIFPYDKVPDKLIKAKLLGNIHKMYRALYCTKCGLNFPENRNSAQKIPYYMAKFALKPVHTNFLINKLDKIARKNNTNDTQYYLSFIASYGVRNEIMPAYVVENLITATFEGRKVKIFKNYDYYLSNLYGKNYMKLPPKSQRNTGGHSIKKIVYDTKKLAKH